jgi:hypothetical protein
MTRSVFVSGTYNRSTYHLQEDCRRLARANSTRTVSVTNPVLNDLSPCKACMGVTPTGGREGKNYATMLKEKNND